MAKGGFLQDRDRHHEGPRPAPALAGRATRNLAASRCAARTGEAFNIQKFLPSDEKAIPRQPAEQHPADKQAHANVPVGGDKVG